MNKIWKIMFVVSLIALMSSSAFAQSIFGNMRDQQRPERTTDESVYHQFQRSRMDNSVRVNEDLRRFYRRNIKSEGGLSQQDLSTGVATRVRTARGQVESQSERQNKLARVYRRTRSAASLGGGTATSVASGETIGTTTTRTGFFQPTVGLDLEVPQHLIDQCRDLLEDFNGNAVYVPGSRRNVAIAQLLRSNDHVIAGLITVRSSRYSIKNPCADLA